MGHYIIQVGEGPVCNVIFEKRAVIAKIYIVQNWLENGIQEMIL